MDELALIRAISQQVRSKGRSTKLKLGPGDDCAIFSPKSSPNDLVFTTDFVLEDRHFTLDTHTAADVGHLALARALSDVAAMGAEPRFCLISLALPQPGAPLWIKNFYRGLMALANRFGVEVAGGDLASFDKVVVDVVLCGELPKGTALLRSGARAGDLVYVSGPLGGSAMGLATKRGATWRRHKRPEPKVALGLRLRRLGVRAAMDLSDGLSLDLHRFCVASGLSAALHLVPQFRGATADQALHGGEDYELLFAAPARIQIPEALAIGVLRRATKACAAGTILLDNQQVRPEGWNHFALESRLIK